MKNRGAPGPAQRIPRHEAEQQSLRGDPARQSPDVGHISERLHSLLKLEVAKIFLNDIGHGHAQPGGKVLCRHCALLVGILQELDQAVCQPACVSGRIEFDGQFLALRHLPEVWQIRAKDGYSVSAREMSDAAASCG